MANQKETFEKLKSSVREFVSIDPELLRRAHERMRASMFGKFLGRALPLNQVRLALSDLWEEEFGSVSVADMPNGFYYIRCEDPEMRSEILFGGPWIIGGMILKLTPWRENFQAAFEELDSTAVWVQLHHLPIEFWDGEVLEKIAMRIGRRLLKIDERTVNLSRAKFARICVEINLSEPLKRGIWVGYSEKERVLVVPSYERLPVFCYKCGRLWHTAACCTANLAEERGGAGHGEPEEMKSEMESESELSFGPWMIAHRRRGRGRGRGRGRRRGGPGGGQGSIFRNCDGSLDCDTWPLPAAAPRDVETSLPDLMTRELVGLGPW